MCDKLSFRCGGKSEAEKQAALTVAAAGSTVPLLGVGRIILMGHNADRLKLGRKFGATDIISNRDDAQAIAEAVQLTQGGAESVAECVGLRSSFDLAIGVARPGGVVGSSGFPTSTNR